MSLVRLLTAGKSLIGLKDAENRYRMSDPRVMPNFGSGQNRFNSKARPDLTQRATPPLMQSPASAAEPATSAASRLSSSAARGQGTIASTRPDDSSDSSAPKPGTGPESSPGAKLTILPMPRRETGASPSSDGERLGWIGGWTSKLSALIRRAPRNAAKSGIPRLEQGPVQGELSLERVQVVRNDLSEEDLEFASPKAPEKASANGTQPAEKTEPAQTAWERVSTRVFHAGET
jgi:hypothetical protein